MRAKQYGQARGKRRGANPFSLPVVRAVTVKGCDGPITRYKPTGPLVQGFKPYQGQALPTPQRDKAKSRNDRRFYLWDTFKP